MVRTTIERFIAEGKLGETVSFDYRILHPDGSVCYLHSERMIRDVDDKGKAVRIVGIEQDITERKEAEVALQESEERFKLVAEAANVFVYEVDYVDNTLTVFRGEEVLGYEPREVSHSLDWWSKQIHPDDRAMVQQKAQKATDAGRDVLIEYRIRRKQGDYIIVHDTASMMKDDHGKVIRIVGGLRDVTERKENEKALLRSKQLVEEKAAEVEKFANSMEQLAQERTRQLQEAERLAAIGATAGMVGHDIRNPLQAISGDVYLLKDYLTSMPESQTKHDVEDSLNGIDKNVSYINKIVADLQDYSRKLTPDYHFVNLTEIIRQTLEAVDIPENVIVTNNTECIGLRTDPEYIRRALTNLINNAVQAMPNGGNLTVAVYETHDKERIALTVADTGVGISETLKQKIFTPMVTTKSKGQGLGLAVVKRLIEALGGTICFESKEGKGTKFIIDLPAKGT
jgi:PAS domain S-box-containing protein